MIALAKGLDRTRFEVHLACFHLAGAWLPRAAEAADSLSEFPIQSFRHPRTLARMREFAAWCRARRIAVLHATDLYANVFALPAAALARVPVRIGNRREINPDKSAGLLALQRAGYAFAHRVVANSTAAAARLRREGVSARAIAVVANGVDLSAHAARAHRSRLRRIITVANLRPEKAHETLIDAAAILIKEYPDAEFLIVGGGERLAALKALADRRGVASHVRFLGHRDDVPALMAESDVFALPSRSEAFPNSVLEAMAAGLPIVACSVGGIPELIDQERNGLLVPAGNATALSAALGRLMASPEWAASLGRAARQTVEARFSFDRMVRSFEGLYLDLLRQRAAPASPATHPLPS